MRETVPSAMAQSRDSASVKGTWPVCVGVILFFAQAFAFGQDQPTRAVPQDQCVRVTVQDRDGNISLGSGALIRDNIIATCNHVVSDRKSDKVTVNFPGWRDVTGYVLGVDQDLDIAIIMLAETPNCKPLESNVILRGGPLSVQGFGSGEYRQAWGVLSHSIAGEWRKVDGASSRSGDSGGPIIDENGHFVGTLWGSVDDETYFTSAKDVLKLLESLLCYNDSLDNADQLAARYHTRGRVERFFKRGTDLAARYHSRNRVNRFFKRAKTRKVVA